MGHIVRVIILLEGTVEWSNAFIVMVPVFCVTKVWKMLHDIVVTGSGWKELHGLGASLYLMQSTILARICNYNV